MVWSRCKNRFFGNEEKITTGGELTKILAQNLGDLTFEVMAGDGQGSELLGDENGEAGRSGLAGGGRSREDNE